MAKPGVFASRPRRKNSPAPTEGGPVVPPPPPADGVGGPVVPSTHGGERVRGPGLLDETGRQVLRVGAGVDGALRAGPDLPRPRRLLELVLEPGLLRRPEDRLRRRVPLRVGDMVVVE